jgi:YVTN family beta-propeller protein
MTSCRGRSSRRAFIICCFAFFVLLGGAQQARSFVLNGYHWPDGTTIEMHLQLGAAPPLQDGSGSWDASAADALAIWNQYLAPIQFAQGAPIAPAGGDGANNVFFASTIYGESFPNGVLAVTLGRSRPGGVFAETDVIFNSQINWDSYRGPIQGSGPTGTYDLHRVALHEFGHVLGLDHPDSRGQHLEAIMNSIISDLDHLADDDIAGVHYLYPAKLTSSLNPPSVRSGDNFSYQLTANNNASHYSATGLPPGLGLDAASGLISGHCPTSGVFPVDITAEGPHGLATGRIQIVIDPLPIFAAPPSVQIGDNFSYQISAGNNPTAFDAIGLPIGLQIDKSSGLISGVPQVSGNFQVRVVARSAVSEAATTMYLFVMPARITSTGPSVIELGDSYSYHITATNNPRSFAASNLPPGLQFDASTAVISGTPSLAGVFNFTVSAQTDYGIVTASIFLQVLAPRITSTVVPVRDIGSAFTFQITASNHPYRFSATGLPPGLQLDSATGKITGAPELSGRYDVQVTAEGPTGIASATLTITIQPLDVPDVPVKKLPLSVYGTMVADPMRPRVYAATNTGVAVIDTDLLSVVQTIPLPLFISDLNISVDGNRLWVTNYFNSTIQAIDLNTLTVSATITTSLKPKRIREGADGRLYVTDYNQGDVFQVDASTGATLSQFSPRNSSYGGASTIEMSPDRKIIYVLVQSQTTPLASYAIVSGGSPQLIQRLETASAQDYYQALAVNPDGKSLSVISRLHQTPDPTLVRSTADLNVVQGSLLSANFPTDIGYSFDGSLLFQTMQQRSRIDVFQTATFQLARTITLPERAIPADEQNATQSMAVDRTNSYFFVSSIFGTAPGVYVYSLTPPPRSQTPAKSLLNISTRLRVQSGDNALIGGFIINGQAPKQLVLRGLGPSLPVAGNLADPVLQLYDSSGAMMGQNDNWNAHRAEVIATGIAPANERDAAIVATLQPGSYTAVLRGVANSTGVALVELYDLAPVNSRIANISTRGKVETGDNVMIGGFILGGDQATTVVVRAIGPALAQFGVSGVLGDPMLEVHDGNGALLAEDDDWRRYQEAQLIQTGLAPTDDREAAMLLVLQPGAYTAIVRGKNDTAGVGLVEVYNLDAN